MTALILSFVCCLYVTILWVVLRKHEKFTKVGVGIGGFYGILCSIAAPLVFSYYSLLWVLIVTPFMMYVASVSDKDDSLPYF